MPSDFAISPRFLPAYVRVGLAGRDGHPVRPADVGERAVDALRVEVLLVRHEDLDVRVPGLVGIAVGRDVLALRARRVDQGDGPLRLAPDAHGGELDVGDVERQPALLRDGDRLVHRLEALVRLVAAVRHVEAAVLRRGLRQLDELLGRRVAADLVLEARGEAHRAFPHRLRDERGHLRASPRSVDSRLKSLPITRLRTVSWPTIVMTLTVAGALSRSSRYAAIGQGESPSGPRTSVVMPWEICVSASGSVARPSVE